MLLFNCYPVYCLIVDVHFNISYVIIQLPLVALCTHFQSKISIRHMLLFNPLSIGISDSLFPFQYIPCYYPTQFFCKQYLLLAGFQYIPCYYSTFPVENPLINLLEFQYISCCYSTEYTKMDFRKGSYFNTSYVVIQRTPSFLIS